MRTITVGIRVDAIKSLDHAKDAVEHAVREARPWVMTFVNPASAILAARRPELRALLEAFDMVAPDGSGMVLAMRMLHRTRAARVSFDSTSLAPIVFQSAIRHALPVVLVGAAPGVAEKARDVLEAAFPDLRVQAVFDGFSNPVEPILAMTPGIVVAGMGSFVQERFLLSLIERGWTGVGFTCGGYLDQLALKGTQYYPVWVDRYNFRWAFRLLMEPRRLWRRYLLEYPEFGLRLAHALIVERRSGT